MTEREDKVSSRDAEEPASDRSRANLFALLFILALFVGAFWLFKELERHREIDNCIASGRRDCIPLTPDDARSP